MAVHEQVLATVQRLCLERRRFTFTLNDVVKALPGVPPNTVRTQVGSYCCVNAKQHHAHRQPYFRRVSFGEYELLAKYRMSPPLRRRLAPAEPLKDVIHAVISQSARMYVAECLEIAVVTQGRTLDETLANLREAIELHLDGDQEISGVAANPRLAITYETALAG